MMAINLDKHTVDGFGDEWDSFDQQKLQGRAYDHWFERYFGIFPFDKLQSGAVGFDLGCGSGRWAAGVASKVGRLHCVDPALKALNVARRRLAGVPNVEFHLASANDLPFEENSQDFGYSLGVLHHVPDTRAALDQAVRCLKVGAPFLIYLYYRFDGRPTWFVALWRASDLIRRGIARLPFSVRRMVTDAIAIGIYWPLSRLARLAESAHVNVTNFPLSAYRNSSIYTLRTDALDRFGTRLEHRFNRSEIEEMMTAAGLVDICFSEREPFWVACGKKDSPPS